MLTEAARLAAERRTDDEARAIGELATRLRESEGAPAAQALDWELMALIVEASGNVVLRLIMNSIRALYLEHADAFRAVVGDLGELVPLYEDAAAAIAAGDTEGAAIAVADLTGRQERALLGALRG